jgi:hypothetical protein
MAAAPETRAPVRFLAEASLMITTSDIRECPRCWALVRDERLDDHMSIHAREQNMQEDQ